METYLTGTVGTRATDTGDTRNGTTGTPRLSRGLVASLLADSVRLPLVLRKALCSHEKIHRHPVGIRAPGYRCTHCEPAERHQDGWGR